MKDINEQHFIYLFETLTNYVLNNSSISYTVINWNNGFYEKLLKYCRSNNTDYAIISIELLVSIIEQSKARAVSNSIPETEICLKEIINYNFLKDMLKARVNQCLRDLKL